MSWILCHRSLSLPKILFGTQNTIEIAFKKYKYILTFKFRVSVQPPRSLVWDKIRFRFLCTDNSRIWQWNSKFEGRMITRNNIILIFVCWSFYIKKWLSTYMWAIIMVFSTMANFGKCNEIDMICYRAVSAGKPLLLSSHLLKYIRHFSKLIEFSGNCQVASDWTCFVDHKL